MIEIFALLIGAAVLYGLLKIYLRVVAIVENVDEIRRRFIMFCNDYSNVS